jgi:hypothetical protein
MARRVSKADAQLGLFLLVFGLPAYGIYKLAEALGAGVFGIGIAVFIVLIFVFKLASKEMRRKKLMQKYNNNEALVDLIMSRSFWQGQTKPQLVDSLGRPQDIDEKVLKTKRKEIWKYNHMGGNRYGLRITIENDEVVGWDQKD